MIVPLAPRSRLALADAAALYAVKLRQRSERNARRRAAGDRGPLVGADLDIARAISLDTSVAFLRYAGIFLDLTPVAWTHLERAADRMSRKYQARARRYGKPEAAALAADLARTSGLIVAVFAEEKARVA